MTDPARALDPDERSDAGPDWGSEEARQLFASVRELCGVRVGNPSPISVDMIALARAEAKAILEELDQEFEFEEAISADAESAEPMDDDSTFARACHQADAKRARLSEDESERLRRLRRLMEPGVTLERAWSETNHPWRVEGRAAESTVFALMQGLCERDVKALDEPDTRRRLSELSDDQLVEVGTRLRKLKPEIARPWTTDDVSILIQTSERVKK